ncbi:coiled-coil domain-containing protein 149-like isoform X1 [Argiope bruennichi]|uniref:Coiled-coil domain-containing protein 149 n=1 Tax=Argiope bruennichi TaxID=94029 RepID=A0A8T0ED44_ARGBR|nr:coiled-coil domain-containing protein 149-like isoform X1 [Argiope bruennichi]KAF8770781.1 Coiled-coil domain-containing protein 149 [Argiope bruennichi]
MTLKFQKLEEDYLSLLAEFNTVKCKLECKTDSLLILSQELEKCRIERDQYKLMADQLRTRYSALKRRVEGWGPSLMGVYDVDGLKCEREKSLVQLLVELKDQNKFLKYEVEDLKQKLEDASGDMKILREELNKKNTDCFQEYLSPNFVPFSEKEALVKQLEIQKIKCMQLTQDLEAVLDEKEELITSRDQYIHKYERLNQQMNYILRGDQQKPVDIDGVLMENKYLQERIKQAEEEKAVTASALAKCRALLEKKRTKGGMRSTIASGLAISAKQVEQLLQSSPFLDLTSKSSNVAEFRNLVITLLENLSDKSIALSHQKKTNKILGNRVSELEERIKSLEVSNVCHHTDPSKFSFLIHASKTDELHLPSKSLHDPTLESSLSNIEKNDDLTQNILDDQSLRSDDQFSISESSTDIRTNSGFSDLDILPTKDYPSAGLFDRQGSMSSCSHYSDSKISSESFSPVHDSRTLHSDSEVTPRKFLNNSVAPSTADDRHEWSSLDVDDLPPKLQKFVASALAEVDKNSENDTVVKSPLHKQKTSLASVLKYDPGC